MLNYVPITQFSHTFAFLNLDTVTIEITQFITIISFYAKLHFQLKWMGGQYYQKEPKILSNEPCRIEPKIHFLFF